MSITIVFTQYHDDRSGHDMFALTRRDSNCVALRPWRNLMQRKACPLHCLHGLPEGLAPRRLLAPGRTSHVTAPQRHSAGATKAVSTAKATPLHRPRRA